MSQLSCTPRNVVHYAGQYAWFSALLLIPLAEVIAIEFTMPLWIAILAAAFLGERLYGWKIAALIVGFGGVLMIVKPGLTLNVGHVVALAAARDAVRRVGDADQVHHTARRR